MASGCVVRYPSKRKGTVFRLKYTDAEGQQHMETLGSEREGWTERKAKAELRDRLVKVEKHGWRKPKKAKFAEYAEAWFEESARKRRWSKNSQRAYRGSLKRLLPYFSAMPLDAIRPRHVAAYTPEALKKWGPTTVNQTLSLLDDILASARREELIQSNPVDDVERPRTPDYERDVWRILELDEVRRLLKAFTNERARLIFLTTVLTGMRRGEIQNLRWREVDFLEAAIRVKDAKTKEGDRSIAMTKTLSDGLWAWRLATPYQGDDEYVFANPETGRRLNPDRWWSKQWKAALKAAGIEGYVRPFHDQRHTSLTHGAAAGEDIVKLGARAGHASPSTTKQYVHLAGVVFQKEAEALEGRLLGEKAEAEGAEVSRQFSRTGR